MDKRKLSTRVRATLIGELSGQLPLLFDAIQASLLKTANSHLHDPEYFDYLQASDKIKASRKQLIMDCIEGLEEHLDLTRRKGSSAEDPDFTGLELLDDQALEDIIVLDTLVAKVIAATQPTLDHYVTRVEYLAGRNVAVDNSPLMRGRFCELFLSGMRKIDLEAEPRKQVNQVFEGWLLSFWPQLISKLNQYLVDQDVLPELEKQAKKRIKNTQTPPAPKKPDFPPAENPTARGSAANRASSRLTRHRGRSADSRFEGNNIRKDIERWLQVKTAAGTASEEGGYASYSCEQFQRNISDYFQGCRSNHEHYRQCIEALQNEGLEAVLESILAQREQSLNALDGLTRGVVKILDQSFTRMFKRCEADAAIRNVLLDIELPIARLAMADPSFCERANHPARRLIDELCKSACALQPEAQKTQDPLDAKIEEVVERLSVLELSLKTLSGMLNDFIEFVEKDKRQQRVREQRLFEEEEAGARMGWARQEVTRVMVERFGDEPWPQSVLTFAQQYFAKVLYMAAIRDGVDSKSWEEALALLDRLLMLCVSGQMPAYNQWQQISGRFTEVLELAGCDRYQVDKSLEDIRAALKALVKSNDNIPLPKGELRLFDPAALNIPGKPPVDDKPDQEADMAALAQVDSLKYGTWIEFTTSGTKPLRAKYAGVVKANGVLIFTNRKALKVAEETRYRLARKLACGEARIVDASRLFDKAFDQVVHDIRSELSGGLRAGTLH